MALDSRRPIPYHLPLETVTLSNYEIPTALGIFLGSPATNGTWTLPPNINIVSGASLQIRNTGPGEITIAASSGDVIDGPSVIPAEFTCMITTDFTNNWRVMFITSITGATPGPPTPPVTGSTTFQVTSLAYIVQSTVPQTLGYFPWAQSVYSGIMSGYLTVSADVPGPDFTIRMKSGNTTLASQIITTSGVFIVPMTAFPTSNTRLEIDTMRNQPQPLNPTIFGITLTLLQ